MLGELKRSRSINFSALLPIEDKMDGSRDLRLKSSRREIPYQSSLHYPEFPVPAPNRFPEVTKKLIVLVKINEATDRPVEEKLFPDLETARLKV
jgi:hypothetical protein